MKLEEAITYAIMSDGHGKHLHERSRAHLRNVIEYEYDF